MAIKDWTNIKINKMKNGELIFDNRKTEERIFVKYNKYGLESKNKEPYAFYTDNTYPKSFKTKFEALKYAKSYMRSH